MGLANGSAQGCNGCHYEAADTWRQSDHANGLHADVLQAAFARAATPGCAVCHQPLWSQQRERFPAGDPSPAVEARVPNDVFDIGLSHESVTCAACHLREGRVVAAEPVLHAPHPMATSEQMRKSTLCATCHAVVWPGGDRPLYDTYGEWLRSPYAKLGIQCQDCHMRRAVGERHVSHDVSMPMDRALSVLLDGPAAPLLRGAPPVAWDLTLQNTGAGHAFPTGSPWRWIRVRVALIGPIGKKGEPQPHPKATWEFPLRRAVADAAPWTTLSDTRVPPGEEVRFPLAMALPADAPAGPWTLDVALTEVHGEVAESTPFFHRSWRIPVE